jgi:hypothetical protein
LHAKVPLVINDAEGTNKYAYVRKWAKTHTKWANVSGPKPGRKDLENFTG